MDHPTHQIDAYKDGFVWVTFCKICGREEENLSSPCPGKYQPLSQDKLDDFGNKYKQIVDTKSDKK